MINEKRSRCARDRKHYSVLAAKTTQRAEDLPNRAAIRSAVGVTVKEEHHADLLSVFASRRQENCNRIVTFCPAVNNGKRMRETMTGKWIYGHKGLGRVSRFVCIYALRRLMFLGVKPPTATLIRVAFRLFESRRKEKDQNNDVVLVFLVRVSRFELEAS